MRLNLLTLFFLIFACCSLFAQPANDDCGGLIDLGVIPYCPDDELFTNVDATESNIGANNFPTGCSGIGDITFVGRDVWFKFTTDATTVDYTIRVTGLADGMGSTPLTNPQVALYRGDCAVDDLFLVGCGKAADTQTEIAVDVFGLDPNTDYFLRINDWSGTATPNAGTFKLCVKELDPIYVMGEDTEASSCQGTLYDSGGPDNDYSNNENNTFTVCPNEFFSCLAIDLIAFQTENNFDDLVIFEGDNTGGPVIANLTGNVTNSYLIETTSSCITFQFTSDGSVTQSGFELTWACNAAACPGSSTDNPTVITSIPADLDNETTCDDASNFGTSPCGNSPFLAGPEYVYQYDSPGGICVSISIENAEPGTGVLVLNGPIGDPNTGCVSSSANGFIGSANMETAGTYYIVVANAAGCTDFDILIEESECSFPNALADALCNPLNACDINTDGTPNQFPFEDGFQDVDIINGVNAGCWFGVGFEPDFVWFSVEIQQDGPFGFILSSAGTPSDIDYNVWGPFTSEEVCEMPGDVTNFITNNEPIRSSYAGFAVPTGLTDIHPDLGYAITDEYDCDGVGMEQNDQFVRTIDGITGEHYLVLFNDFGNNIEGIVNVDWGPSGDGVLEVDLETVAGADTVVCSGESVQLEMPAWIQSIEWLDATNTLSCDDCLDPLATPTVTTSYYAVVEGLCVEDTVKVDVFVYDVALGPDVTVCLGEEVELAPDVAFPDVTYNWTGANLSCTTCPLTVVSTDTPGTFEYTIEQVSATCSLTDVIDITVLAAPAPIFSVSDSTAICIGSSTNLGDPANDATFTYEWTSVPAGFTSSDPDPSASPLVNTTYYVSVSNSTCPVQSLDSVFVSVDTFAIVMLANDTTVCQSELVTLGLTDEQMGVTYSWSPTTNLDDPNIANPVATVEETTEYTLTSTLGGCVSTNTITVTSTVISIEILEPDTATICRGDTYVINTLSTPANAVVEWTTDNNTFTGSGNALNVMPEIITTYFASVSVPGCAKMDTFTIDVDSLPSPTLIMPSDTSVCRGALVILSSQAYLPSDFPLIEHQWTPNSGFESPDSLYNMVIMATDTILYFRETTNGVCTAIDSALVSIKETTTITITPDDPIICANESIEMTASSPDITEFTWSGPGNLTCTECPVTSITPPGTSNYTIEGEFLGCPVMTEVTITVVPPPNSGLIPNTSICAGTSINLVGTPDPTATYTWTSDPAGFNSTDPDPTVSPTVTTTYFLSVETDGCPVEMQEVTIEIVDGAAFSMVSEDIEICLDDGADANLELSVMGNSNGGTYVWSPDFGSGPNPILTVTEADEGTTQEYEVTFTDICGDMATEIISVTVYQGVDINAPGITIFNLESDTTTFAEGDTINLSITTDPPGGNTYQWFSGSTVLGTDINQGFFLIDPFYEFSILVTNADGCTDTSFTSISVIEAIWELPNAFTPNGDGQNDNFRLISQGKIDIQSFQIWDRWGELVYSGTDPNGWNGTFRGRPMPTESYIYRLVLLRPSGEIEERKGDVTLIR